ncbi:hypothetical protein GJ496_000095 [Pomphorhynchus laevis]|nr:hypothetical protein GJ496_000095 [Pomphorhynchus laevis]
MTTDNYWNQDFDEHTKIAFELFGADSSKMNSLTHVMEHGKLRLYNSLTRTKEIFTPKDPNLVKWYICGPTVYDSAHMGHARTYISFDIIRRLLEDYFGYNVLYCMNVTDIDDKIIKRAREQHLLNQYLNSKHSENSINSDVVSALKFHERLIGTEDDPEKKALKEKIFSEAKEAYRRRLKCKQQNQLTEDNHLNEFEQILPEWLDSIKGSTVQDTSIFIELARYFETEFHMDMKALNIKPASVLTRVSEYINEVIAFVEKIIEHGFAYVSNSSVYFNTEAYKSSDTHSYPKLLPEAANDLRSLTEGEGALLSSQKALKDKKNKNDFVLWKASKSGEPSWTSPWGKGRPGWHIECSAMACSILGKDMDIHSGGIDLKFPHHENEIAQSEAAYNSDNWVKYFLHSGHLTIQGCKMSKSLKNFITIRKSLEMYSFRQIRLLFLLHTWNDTLDFSDSAMNHTLQYEKLCQEYFLLVKDWIRNSNPYETASQKKWTNREFTLNNEFNECRKKVHEALCDSFDTPTVMKAMREMISSCNTYMDDRVNASSLNILLVKNIASYIDRMFKIFGLIKEQDDFGFTSSTGDNSSFVNFENKVLPYVKALVDFRDTVRTISLKHKIPAILNECDKIRDKQLIDLGVKLEDRDGRTVIKIYDPVVLKQQEADHKHQHIGKELNGDVNTNDDSSKTDQLKLKAKKNERDAMKRIPPNEYFLKDTDKYSKFDSTGFPIADIDGKPLTKSAIKKLTKAYILQEKRYQEYIQSGNKSSSE